MAAISMAATAAQGVAKVQAQKDQAKAQEKAQFAASAREMERQQMSMSAERMQQGDEETTIAQEQLKANREADEAIATTVVAGEDAGVSGTAAGLNVQEYERQNASYQGALAMQTRMNDSARRLSLANSGQQYVGNMANINKDIAQPDYLGVGLETVAGMASAYQGGVLQNAATKNATLTAASLTQQAAIGAQRLQIGRETLRGQRVSLDVSKAQTGLYGAQQQLANARRLKLGSN
tara:strand:- start:1110 stop:1817 length:708 start_codon:yes stop_codon:yes gene_type:complete